MSPKFKRTRQKQWFRADLHIHTPGSVDYQEKEADYLDILHRAEMRGLDIIAFTDHNTVAGYRAMMTEIEQPEFLEQLNRAQEEEQRRLAEYRRLLERILVLPGFEFTAMFGFHVLGIFSPQTPIRQLEHILLSLNIPPQALDEGSSKVGASSDVLTAYRAINEAGGVVIAAHANSTHGVAMKGFDFGGQTKIAYTQDNFLHCLEVTDLDRRGRGTTSRFFDGTKPEYPRRMRCIQGSDAHRLVKDPRNEKNLGIGDRVTEVLLPERRFEALRDVFRGNDFALTRPYRGSNKEEYDYVHAAREEGESIVQAFHESMARKAAHLDNIVNDVCAFANTNGGTIYVGVSSDIRVPPVGLANPGGSVEELRNEIAMKITPPLDVEIDTQETYGKPVIRIQVPRGDDPPYAIDDNKIYVRDESETSLAVRDEIVRLVHKNQQHQLPVSVPAPANLTTIDDGAVQDFIAALEEVTPSADSEPVITNLDDTMPPVIAEQASGHSRKSRKQRSDKTTKEAAPLSSAPRTGVEIVGTETRKGQQYHIMRDLRNGNIVKNVTKSSARRLWHYAITERETNPVDADQVQWVGDVGFLKHYKRGGVVRYDLVQRDNGQIRVYYGVTDDGMHGPWQQFIIDEPELLDEAE